MYGNQPVGMSICLWALSQALDYHFNEGCTGVLIPHSWDTKVYEHADLVEFMCKKCKRIVTIVAAK